MLFTLFIILSATFFIMMIAMQVFDEVSYVYGAVTITVGVIAVISCIFLCIESRTPTAMEAYRGKTTLEITYKDGVAIDSVVVFKERK